MQVCRTSRTCCRRSGAVWADAGHVEASRCKDFDMAVQTLEETIAAGVKALGDEDPLIAAGLNNKAVLFVLRGDYPAARQSGRHGPGHRPEGLCREKHAMATVRENLAALEIAQAQFDKADADLALAEATAADLPEEHPARIAALLLRARLDEAGPVRRGPGQRREGPGDLRKTTRPGAPLPLRRSWGSWAKSWPSRAVYQGLPGRVPRGRARQEALGAGAPVRGARPESAGQRVPAQASDGRGRHACAGGAEVVERAYGKKNPMPGKRLPDPRPPGRGPGSSAGRGKAFTHAQECWHAATKEHPDLAVLIGDLAALDRTPANARKGSNCFSRRST